MSENEQEKSAPWWITFLKASHSVASGTTMPFDYVNRLTKTYDTYVLLRPHLTGSPQRTLDEDLGVVVQDMEKFHGALQSTKDTFKTEFFDRLNDPLEKRITEYQNEYATRE